MLYATAVLLALLLGAAPFLSVLIVCRRRLRDHRRVPSSSNQERARRRAARRKPVAVAAGAGLDPNSLRYANSPEPGSMTGRQGDAGPLKAVCEVRPDCKERAVSDRTEQETDVMVRRPHRTTQIMWVPPDTQRRA
ncbi:MAG: hypothetical protein JOY78_10300 [Pseudonocardia sp.]|nr:hypothetical protein [Pseudonocardia sp.]